ncbi:site-specific DNA-methyltransferase [uncultured Clostridium sp.]|uniref:DNA-methyltransferase n=1 Tax=uncultured Clostridium sp. TaxID=59620 RepID=UPI00262BB39C|nr:site-specific DNA-methyltransferase [uncultured Clostridium sp.]
MNSKKTKIEPHNDKKTNYIKNTIKLNSVYNIDGIALLDQIYDEFGNESIDMILLDLPYTFKGKQRVTANKWDLPIDIEKLFVLSSKLLTKTGALVMTATNPFSAYLIMESINLSSKYKDIDFINYKYEWIWEKDNGSNFVHVKHQPFRVHEQILVFGKAPTTYNKSNIYMEYNPQFTYSNPYSMKRDMSNVENLEGFKGRTDTDNKDGKRYPRSVQKFNLERGLHPTQKPTKLFNFLIKTHCPENGIVVDVCAGSGTTAISCIETKRNYIINDIEHNYFNIIKERILENQTVKICSNE